MKSIVLSLILFASTAASAAIPLDSKGSSSVKVARVKNAMVTGFEENLGRELTEEERDSVVSFATAMVLAGNSVYTQTAGPSDDVTTVLFCLAPKAAILVKLTGGLCTDTSGSIRLVSGDGVGLSIGFALSGIILVHKGPPGSLKGKFAGLTAGAAFGELTSALKGVLRLVGGELGYMTNVDNKSEMLIAGISFGPILDLSMAGINIR